MGISILPSPINSGLILLKKFASEWDAWLAQLTAHATLDPEVVNSSLTLGIEDYFKKKKVLRKKKVCQWRRYPVK